MTRERAKEEIEELSRRLISYQHEYYVLNRPSISDLEYDRMLERLLNLEKQFPDLEYPDSPTQRIGSDLSQELPEAPHTIPVLSLDKVYSEAELSSWIEKSVRNTGSELSFILEEKIDGSSIVLYYESGLLTRALTRGNGLVGNDVTRNVKTIGAVPLRLPGAVDLAVRGEIFLPLKLFHELNSRLEAPYANPRNFASGALRRVKSSEVAGIPLDILVYEGYFSSPVSTHLEILEELDRLGFKLNPRVGFFSGKDNLKTIRDNHPTWQVGNLEDLPSYIRTIRQQRASLDYEIDGLVVKVNEIEAREKLGFTGHHPRWAIAFKFEAPEAVTRVENIEVQVGRTGRVTPVARVKPVKLSGSTISNITLHNQDYIDMLELALGDRVSISKRGDVIPAVERVLEKNEEGNTTWNIPPNCPGCKSLISRLGAHHFCVNPDCPDQVRGRIAFFAARGQMDIENLGSETLDLLIDRGFVRDVQDLYRFNPDDLLGLQGFGEKKVALIKAGLKKSKHQPYRVVLPSLGIPEVGQKAVELLIEAGFRDIDSLLNAADKQDPYLFTAIHGIGERTALTLIRELSSPEVRHRIEELKKAGLCFSEEVLPVSEPPEAVFSGQTWCVTGSFTHFKPRELAMEEVKRLGGRVSSSVTGKITHLLAGPGAGSKLDRARSLGVQVVSEEEFLKLLNPTSK